MFEQEFGRLSVDMAKRLFRHYERSLLISTPIMSHDEMRENVKAFNDMFGFRADAGEGTLRILNETWRKAKDLLSLNMRGTKCR